MLKNNKKTAEESVSYSAASYSQEDEDLTEAQIKELELVNSEALGNEPKKITEEPVEKLKKEVKKKQSKKSKKKSKKKKKK